MSELEKFIYAEELNLPTRIKSVAVREYQTDIGPADYVLFVDRQPVGIVEAKKDTPKSTILDAIRYTFHPQWNLSFDDSDFYLCQTAEPFTIDITVGDLPEEFLDIAKRGNHLRGWDIDNHVIQDEPTDGLEEVLTIRLKVGENLEPTWQVINERVWCKYSNELYGHAGVVCEFTRLVMNSLCCAPRRVLSSMLSA